MIRLVCILLGERVIAWRKGNIVFSGKVVKMNSGRQNETTLSFELKLEWVCVQ